MINDRNNEVKEITVKYNDGTERVINKGAVITDKVNEDNVHNLTFEFADISGEEFVNLVLGVIQLGEKMGVFNYIDD